MEILKKHIFELVSSEAQGIVNCSGDLNVRLHQTPDTSKHFYSGEKKNYQNIKLMMRSWGSLMFGEI